MKQVKCDLCGKKEYAVLSRKQGNAFVRCCGCGHYYMLRRPDTKELARIYNKDYFKKKYQNGNEKVTGDYLADKSNIMKFVEKRFVTLAKYKKPGRLLDIGCAYGFYLEHAVQLGWKVSGLELEVTAAEYARKRFPDVVIGRVEIAGYKQSSYDAVTMWLVLEHLADPNLVLKKVYKWLKKGGVLGIKVPHIGGITYRLDPDKWIAQHPEDHFCDYDINTLSALLSKHGFKVLEYETEGIYIDRALSLLGLDIKADEALQEFYYELASKLYLGDSLVMWAKK